MSRIITSRLFIPLFICMIALSQDPSETDKSKPASNTETLITKPERTVEFTTDEATWMGIDASPDGQTLLVDLLGDLYTVSVGGGDLKPLTTGMPWDYQARYSPDGKQIAFISDRNGSDNIWIMNADGSNPHALTKEKKYMFGSPTWSPDGEYIVARRYGTYPYDSYLRQSQLWMFQKDGGTGIQLTKGDPKYTRVSSPAFSPDGKFLYFSAAAGRFNYNTDLAKWEVQRLNRETGEIDGITATYGGGLRPMISPDGKTLLYGTRHDAITGLRARNLENRSEQWLARHITRDDQEGFSAEDTLPGYAFSHDGKSVFILIDGKIHRLDLGNREDNVVPFTAHVKRELGALAKFEDRITEAPLNVKQMRWLQATPDGSQMVFSALGKIWNAVPGGTPHRITSSNDREYAPSVSPDGKSLVWVTWNDRDGGRLWRSELAPGVAGGAPVQLSQSPAFYGVPEWSPDGKRIAFVMGSASGWLEEDQSDVYELKLISSAGGPITSVTHLRSPNSKVTWSGDGKRLYYDELNTPPPTPGPTDAGPTTSLVSIRADGVDKKTHIKFSAPVSATPSPDEKWMLLTRNADAYLAPLPRGTTEPITLNLDLPAVPLKQVTTTGALYGRWLPDGSAFTYAFTNHLYRITREDVSKSAKPAELKPTVTALTLSAPREYAHGKLALRNARIITMKGDEVIERGDIVIEDDRIAAIGAHGKIAIPSDARQIDVSGKTIMPGIVDIHAHLHSQGDVFPDKIWPYAANLAYGVTTTRDPSIESSRVFPYAEMVESGEILGPRIFSTGSPMTTNLVKIESQEDARNAVKRYKEQGADYLKQYMQPRRLQRQWILEAAKEQHINITAEGGGFLKEDLAMVVDGYTGFEHSYPYKLYKDVIELTARAKTVYCPTLIVAYGGWFGQYYWRQQRNYHADEKLTRFTPHEEIDKKTRRRNLLLDEEYFFPEISKGAAEIGREGGNIALGSHGEQQGIGAHWELWMLGMGGLKPIEAIRVATMGGARALGLDKDIGSLEQGKVADLIVMQKNPLENLQNSETIQYVMKAGELYDGASLNEVWPKQKEFGNFYWKQ